MNELELRVLSYQDAYYNGVSAVSDAEFDRLADKVREQNPHSPVLAAVGAPARGSFPKARHLIPMGSQNKAVNDKEFRSWAVKTKPKTFVVQYKLDGASMELQYKRGKLVMALTRGDGKTGCDITANALCMKGVLTELAEPFTGGIRGEVVMARETWKEKYEGKQTARDNANGIMMRKNGSGCEDLSFIAYDAGQPGGAGFNEELEKIAWLKKQGFETVETKLFHTHEEVIAYRVKVAEKRDSLPVDIDGIVIKDGRTDAVDLSRPRPKRQIAFKFADKTAEQSPNDKVMAA